MRFLDVIGGIAEGVDETLSKSIDESNKFAREVKLRKIERRDAAEDIYQKDLREARKVMDTLSGITGGDAGKAAQLFKLGGSSAGAQNIANLINEEQLKMGDDFNLDTMIGFVETETKGFGVEDYLTKLVRRPEEFIEQLINIRNSFFDGVLGLIYFQKGEGGKPYIGTADDFVVYAVSQGQYRFRIKTASSVSKRAFLKKQIGQ